MKFASLILQLLILLTCFVFPKNTAQHRVTVRVLPKNGLYLNSDDSLKIAEQNFTLFILPLLDSASYDKDHVFLNQLAKESPINVPQNDSLFSSFNNLIMVTVTDP